jgi:uncharacterized protein (DUF433 family)
MGQVAVLDRELYSIAEAARLLRIPSAKLRRWLDGYERGGRTYPPVIRQRPTGSDMVTWGEFVEAGLLTEYRMVRGVSLQKLRPVIERMRREFEVPYPLAHFRPLVDVNSKELLARIQQEEQLDEGLQLLTRLRDGQLVWAAPMQAFLAKVEFGDGVATRMYPLGKDRPVAIDPEVSFGIPQIRGIRTEVIAEVFAAEGSIEAAARAWRPHLTNEDVEAALQWEFGPPRVAA